MEVWQIHVAATSESADRNYFTEAGDEAAALDQVKKAEYIVEGATITVTPCRK